MKIIWTILASYLLIGLTLLLFGPLGKALRQAVGDARRDAQRETLLNGKALTPAWKSIAFSALMALSNSSAGLTTGTSPAPIFPRRTRRGIGNGFFPEPYNRDRAGFLGSFA
jgi:hypothetical protein